MYDILQLNDMLVPELLDIAEQLKITGAKKLDKQALIYKILDKQALLTSSTKGEPKEEKPAKKKRIVKTTTANSTEEAIVESEAPEEEKPAPAVTAKPERKIIKKSKTEEQPVVSEPAQPVSQEVVVNENKEEAEKYILELGKTKDEYRVEKRPGIDMRCEGYCLVNSYCSYYKENYEKKV